MLCSQQVTLSVSNYLYVYVTHIKDMFWCVIFRFYASTLRENWLRISYVTVERDNLPFPPPYHAFDKVNNYFFPFMHDLSYLKQAVA